MLEGKKAMVDVVFYLIAIILTAPLGVAIIIYHFLNKAYKQPIIAIHRTVKWTTILFVLSVHFLILEIFTKNIFGYLIVFLLSILTIIIIRQWRTKGEINFRKAYLLLQKISFLIFSLTYVLLILLGIASRYIMT